MGYNHPSKCTRIEQQNYLQCLDKAKHVLNLYQAKHRHGWSAELIQTWWDKVQWLEDHRGELID
jgi:hypothetical protein